VENTAPQNHAAQNHKTGEGLRSQQPLWFDDFVLHDFVKGLGCHPQLRPPDQSVGFLLNDEGNS
jgi:hypothetical protein